MPAHRSRRPLPTLHSITAMLLPIGTLSDTVGYLHLPSFSDAAAVSRQRGASKDRNKYPISCELWSWPAAMTRDGSKLHLSRLHAVCRC